MHNEWWKRAVFYQIYPMSFRDADGDGVGDIRGIVEKLDYLKNLGMTALWLCPVYTSPNDDNGYDISDYRNVNPQYGTLADMDELLAEVHGRGMRLIMDLVVNHTSDEHPWFVEARKSRDNPYRDYYIWRDGRDGGAPNNWMSRFSGSAWEYDAATEQYYLHLYSRKQPDLNWENPAVRAEVESIVRFWLERGVDGFRMDVINQISKVPGLPDDHESTALVGAPFYINGPRVHEYLADLRRACYAGTDKVTVGETKGVDPATALLYAGAERGELDMVFQFELDGIDIGKGGKWDIKPWRLADLKRVMTRWQTALHGRAWNSLFLENHDMPRAVSRFGDDGEYRERSAKLLAALLFTMEGTPFVYQGQELGMTNPRFPDITHYRDVQTLGVYRDFRDNRGLSEEEILAKLHYRSRDNGRTPVQWTAGANAGFTSGTPWMGVNPNYTTVNAEAQLADEDSVLHAYRRLAALRRENGALFAGGFTEHFADHERLYAYSRTLGDEGAYVVLNFSGGEVPAVFPPDAPRSALRLLYGNVQNATDTLQPWEARVYGYSAIQ